VIAPDRRAPVDDGGAARSPARSSARAAAAGSLRAAGRARGHRRRPLDGGGRLALLAVVVAGTIGVTCAPALALSQRGHAFGYSFGEKGEGLGQLDSPAGLAVNETSGDVYVVDAGNQRIERFHPNDAGKTAAPLAVWGWGVSDGESKYEICESSCKAGIAGTGKAQFQYPATLKGHERAAIAIAVDNSTSPSKGDVYVVSNTLSNQNVVEKFNASGEELGQLPLGLKTVGGLSVDAQGVVWVQGTTSGAEPEEIQKGFVHPLVELEEVERFDPVKNELLSTVKIQAEAELTELAIFCPTAGIGVTRDGTTLYANHERLNVFEPEECAPAQEEFNKEEKNKRHATVTSVTAKLHVTGELAEPTVQALDNDYTTAIAVDQSEGQQASGDVYLDNQTSVAAFDTSGALIQRFGTTQLKSGGGAGIGVNAGTGDVYVVDYKGNRVDVFVPQPSGPPEINSLSYENLDPTSTKLIALIDPHGKPTQAFFEYGTKKCPDPSCVQTTPKPVGGGFGDVEFTETVTGLQPGTTYYFKVIATNESGVESESVLHTFTTLPKAAGVLPDNRAWEMVTPPAKEGAAIEAIGGIGGLAAAPSIPVIQASLNGEAITYGANTTTEAGPEGNRAPEAQQIIATRQLSGWSSKDIVTPHFRGEGLLAASPEEYKLFSEDLGLGLVVPWVLKGHLQEPPLVPGVEKEQANIYLRHNLDPACEMTSNCYQPLVTSENITVSPQPEFGGALAVLGASPDLQHVVFNSAAPLLAGAPEKSMYEWNADKPPSEQLQLVSVLPKEGEKEEEPVHELPPPGLGAESSALTNDSQHAISEDGSRVFWSRGSNLYMRDLASGHTINLATPEEGVEEIVGFASYKTASKDGSRIFFTDNAPLTLASTLLPQSRLESGEPPAELYVCELEGSGAEEKCKLTDLTVDPRADLGEAADLTQQILGASDDGTYVYFVANGALAPGAAKGSCPTLHNETEDLSGVCNVYVEHFNGSAWEAPKLVAIVSAEDRGDWGAGPGVTPGYLGRVSSRVSPNGRFLAFMSKRSLTGYDNEDINSKAPGEVLDEEVFLYDAERETLVCASCNPSGQRPTGVLDKRVAGEGQGLLADRPAVWRGQTLAGSIPTWTYIADNVALYQSRYLTDQGRLFFNSPDQLVSLPEGEQFVNKENVYEYEPAGLGSCTDPAGCVGLLSSGTSDRESAFLDASEDGSSVFFITAAQLVASDGDRSLDVYNARVCSSSSPCLTGPEAQPRPCETSETCQGAPKPLPSFETPASTTNSGPGNVHREVLRTEGKPKNKKHKLTRAQLLKRELKKCHKLKTRKKRVACERRARKRYGPKKSAHHRRGTR
jgi:NHL repeat